MQIRFLTYLVIFLFLFITIVSLLVTIFLLVVLVLGKTELDPVHLPHALLPPLRPQLHLLVRQEALVQLGLDELMFECLANDKRVL